ncbi:response regulator [Halomonas sp. ALS9]|uniref:response regulator n=1 Tax=Halomonas sp. ALS9 TaxID=1805819 RepID=UPI0013F4E149|nr:response regulator transcription factor [Halomonas sp. ALS9]
MVVNQSGFIREGLCRLLGSLKDINVVASIYCPQELGDLVQQLRVDVALIDAQLPSQTGFEATRQLRQSGAKARVVILSVNPSLSEVKLALQVGANGFLLREAGIRELEIALHAAVKGDIFLCPTIIKRLSERLALEELSADGRRFINATNDGNSLDDIISKALRQGILQYEQ